MKKGDGYDSLLPTITINICEFELFEYSINYDLTYHLYEDTALKRMQQDDDVVEMHFIEMTKFLRVLLDDLLDPLNDILSRWLLLLGMVDARKEKVYEEIYRQLEELAMKDENLFEAFEVWENMSQTPETIYAYQSRLKYMLDEEAKIVDTMAKGRKEGREEGLIEGIEIGKEEVLMETIRNGLTNGIDLSTLALLTGYSLEKISEIAEQL